MFGQAHLAADITLASLLFCDGSACAASVLTELLWQLHAHFARLSMELSVEVGSRGRESASASLKVYVSGGEEWKRDEEVLFGG